MTTPPVVPWAVLVPESLAYALSPGTGGFTRNG